MFFDGHSDIINDVSNNLLRGNGNVFERHYKQLIDCELKGSIFNMWVEPEYYNKGFARLYNLMYIYKTCIATNKNIITVKSAAELDVQDKFHIVLGVEGMTAIEDDISRIEYLYEFGVRHGMLTWNGQNLLASGAAASEISGLTGKGKQAVKLMQELGMLVDVSHLNDRSFYDLINITRAPVIASHSNSRSLCNNKRNLTDEQISLIAQSGGVIGVNAYGKFVDADITKRTVRRLAEHILHIADLGGVDCVGCGFDFCDYLSDSPDSDAKTHGIENVTKTCNLKNELVALGFTKQDIEKIAYKNFYRVIKKVLR